MKKKKSHKDIELRPPLPIEALDSIKEILQFSLSKELLSLRHPILGNLRKKDWIEKCAKTIFDNLNSN